MPYSYDVEEIVLDINDGIPYSMPDVRVKSGDRNSRKLVAQITYNGEPYDLSNVSASFYMLKPDGTKVFTSAEIIDATQGRISANFTEQMLSVAGNAKGEFLFTRGNDSLLSTPVFKIIIDASINDKNAIESASEFSALVDALDSVHNLDDQIERLDTELRDAIEHLTEIEDDVAIIDETLALAKDFTGANEHRLVQDKDKMDYLGNVHDTIRDARNATVDWMLGEINTLDYEGQHITATDTIEGHAKSAILKGQTLVNTFKSFANYTYSASEMGVKWLIGGSAPLTETLNNDELTMTLTGVGSKVLRNYDVSMLKPNTKYMVKINYTTSFKNGINFGFVKNSTIYTQIASMKSNEYAIFTTPSDLSTWVSLWFGRLDDLQIGDVMKISKPVLIEYQEGMENWDIPYFEGMKSVQMPVLTTTGKNLFDDGQAPEQSYWGDNIRKVNVKENTHYVYSSSPYTGEVTIKFYDIKGDETRAEYGYASGEAFYTPSNTSYIKIHTDKNSNIQIEEGSVATPYEPYKSNILTTSEEVTLRGIGDVRDTLDLMTGEVVERVREIIFDGVSNNDTNFYLSGIGTTENTNAFSLNTPSIGLLTSGGMCDSLPVVNLEDDKCGIVFGRGGAGTIFIKTTKDIATNDQFRNWLKNSNVKVVVPKTPVIKTVDLSDNVVYSYDGVTHYDCSSEAGSLIPTLSVDVPTSLSALVSRQRATIETLETENRALKEGQVELELGHEQQEEEIISTQDAVNFLLFDVLDMAPYELGQKEYDRMAVYIANQIIREKVTYQLAVSKYPQFLTDIDEILVNEGRGDLIVKID